ncbi:uncharacterized protein LOC130963585 [Arachis stenosperma]|uniref:uncharacterized protein LOC130963585 n=1 Tax=Arachis stenosperma TaxID=217475 RepID=UPI0025AD2870|nr:uncharacterized protein LOC130963585 [Arachis stenosperma]
MEKASDLELEMNRDPNQNQEFSADEIQKLARLLNWLSNLQSNATRSNMNIHVDPSSVYYPHSGTGTIMAILGIVELEEELYEARKRNCITKLKAIWEDIDSVKPVPREF